MPFFLSGKTTPPRPYPDKFPYECPDCTCSSAPRLFFLRQIHTVSAEIGSRSPPPRPAVPDDSSTANPDKSPRDHSNRDFAKSGQGRAEIYRKSGGHIEQGKAVSPGRRPDAGAGIASEPGHRPETAENPSCRWNAMTRINPGRRISAAGRGGTFGQPAGALQLHPHDIIVHIIPLADREIPFAHHPHPHLLVKSPRPVRAIDIQFQRTRPRMRLFDRA